VWVCWPSPPCPAHLRFTGWPWSLSPNVGRCCRVGRSWLSPGMRQPSSKLCAFLRKEPRALLCMSSTNCLGCWLTFYVHWYIEHTLISSPCCWSCCFLQHDTWLITTLLLHPTCAQARAGNARPAAIGLTPLSYGPHPCRPRPCQSCIPLGLWLMSLTTYTNSVFIADLCCDQSFNSCMHPRMHIKDLVHCTCLSSRPVLKCPAGQARYLW